MSLNIQFNLLIHTILYGVFLGVMLDTADWFICLIKKKFYGQLLIILFWLSQLPLGILFFHQINQGKFQSYLLLFVLLGSWLYFKFFQKNYLDALKMLVKSCFQVYKWLEKALKILIFAPMVFIFKVISDIIVIPRSIFRRKQARMSKERSKQDGEIQSNQE